MKNKWLLIGATVLMVAGGFLLLRQLKSSRAPYYRFVELEGEQKNFGAFPPEIPEHEFDETEFFS